ncbi:MAG: 3-hydroxyacyl-CoA dehydrogenase family protein [Gemmatimonadota bacterium]|nr:3-hydroxyacyl-CoA dehydrogenase family protein [Gemmatimonadota bacterium]
MKRVAVVGAGTMGHGIAQVAAMAGYDTTITDLAPTSLSQAIDRIRANLEGGVKRGKLTHEHAAAAIDRIRSLDDLTAAVGGADLVIEAIIESPAAKRELFQQLDPVVDETTILATNTSSLSIAQLAESVTRPERVLGMHFFNPVHIMKLVELVVHDRTSDATIAAARTAVERMGKDPIIVRDRPGFASSRLGIVLGLEAMRMVEEGVASPEDIDKAMELGYGHPMGPLRVSDVVGLDVRLAIAEYLHRELHGPWYAPPAILRGKVEAGHLGKKTGKGFYEWPTKSS